MARCRLRSTWHWPVVAYFVALSFANETSTAKPLSIPPSEYWDGVDGAWSSFQIQVGTPPQIVRLLPGTSATAGDSIFVVLPEGCVDSDVPNCANSRGYVFSANKSTTWSVEKLANDGLFELSLYEEKYLGYGGNAYYGFDNISLGLSGSGLPQFSHQLIAGIATPDFWLGSLGLSPLPFNFTTQNDPLPSLLGSLRRGNHIPGTSWAYTAGAHYQDPPAFGSLTLGGYDSSRFVPNTQLSIPFGADQSRDLVVGLQSITYDTVGSSPLLTSGIYAFIDSMVSHIWLPVEACQAFEQALNLTWNETAELYLVDDPVHQKLVAQNPTFTFTIGPAAKAGERVTIRIPYAAFDLNVSAPLVNTTSRYFPLKRALNSTQYTLGRAFLQEAYIIADYDRSNFSIAQTIIPSDSNPDSIVPILAPVDQSTATPGKPVHSSASGGKLSPGALAGIVIAVVVGILCIALVWIIYARRKRRRVPELEDSSAPPKPKSDNHEKPTVELESPKTAKVELPGFSKAHGAHELGDGTASQASPAPKSYGSHELSDGIASQASFAHRTPLYELPDRPI